MLQIVDGFRGAAPGSLARGLAPGVGLSLAYDRVQNGAAMADFRLVDTVDADADTSRPRRRATLVNGSAELRLTVEYTHFPEHHAVLIGGALENIGAQPIPHLRELRPLDLVFDLSRVGAPTVHTIGGGVTHGFFPPIAFHLDAREFISTSKVKKPLRIDSGGTGRSSDLYTPIFFVEAEDGRSGLFAGLEWSALWHAEFTRAVGRGAGAVGGVSDVPGDAFPASDEFHLLTAIEDIDYTLRPGERFEIPRAVVGFYEGTLAEGRNALRRFVNAWFPRYHGGDPTPPVIFNTGGPLLTEERFTRLIPICADLGFEWMQIDWGWFAGCKAPDDCYHGMGNWELVDRDRFPRGIKPIADQVRAHGMQYCTWMDAEEAHPSSKLAREHPEWMLYAYEGNRWRPDMGLVDFGRTDVQDYFIDLIGGMIEEWGIRKLKWDHNIDLKGYWDQHHDPQQRGLLQLRHVRGVWRVWEELTRRHPDLILENCSSGGRRFDLGTFARAHIHHSSDYKYEDDIVRNQISGLNTIMPSYRVISTVTQRGPDAPDSSTMTRFGGILRFQENFAAWSPAARDRVRRHIEVYKSIRHLLKGDFYALFPQPTTRAAWDGWQFHDPATGEGCLLAFRLPRSPEETRHPRLHGLSAETTYRFTDPYTGEEHRAEGASLLDAGSSFALEPNSARLLHYRPV